MELENSNSGPKDETSTNYDVCTVAESNGDAKGNAEANTTNADNSADIKANSDIDFKVDGEADTKEDGNADTEVDGAVDTKDHSDVDTIGDCDVDTKEHGDTDTIGECDADTIGESDADTIRDDDADTIGDSDADTIGDIDDDTIEVSDADTIRYGDVDTKEHGDTDSIGDGHADTKNRPNTSFGSIQEEIARLNTEIFPQVTRKTDFFSECKRIARDCPNTVYDDANPETSPELRRYIAACQVCDLTTSSFHRILGKFGFVDKTLFIKEFLTASRRIFFIKAPPKFGKSTNLDMLRAFLSVEFSEHDSQYQTDYCENYRLFQIYALQIYTLEKRFFDANFGKYPVVYLDFKSLGEGCENASQLLQRATVAAYRQHSYLVRRVGVDGWAWNLDRIPDIENGAIHFANHFNVETVIEQDYDVVGQSWKFLCMLLQEKFGKTVVFLIDNFDFPILQALENPASIESGLLHWSNLFTEKMILQLCSIESTRLLITSAVIFAESACYLSCLHEYMSDEYDTWFGFTGEEVHSLLRKPVFGIINETDVGNSYGGFRRGYSGMNMYNPWSVLSCLQTSVAYGEQKLDLYWLSSYPLILEKLIKHPFVTDIFWQILHEPKYLNSNFNRVVYAADLCLLFKTPDEETNLLANLVCFLVDYGFGVRMADGNKMVLKLPNIEMRIIVAKMLGALNL